MIGVVEDINKEFILSRLSQEEIFERYLGEEISFTSKICSPLRDDSTPTCTFKRYNSGIVWFKDWAGHFEGDCFNLVQELYGLNFYDALRLIAEEFNLVKGLEIGEGYKRKPKQHAHEKTNETARINVQWKAFTEADKGYWSSYGIRTTTLELYCVGSVRNAWVNEKLFYIQKEKDPCYGYYFGTDTHKLYFPKRDSYRFIGNYKGLQGYDQLPERGQLLIVTKSLKDVMLLNQWGIAAVAPSSESSIPTKEEYKDLQKRFNKIVSLYDFDLTGVRSSNKMRKDFGITPMFLTNGKFGTVDYGGKDLTDLVKNKGYEEAKETLKQLIWSKKKNPESGKT